MTLRSNSITIRGRSFTVSELTAKQMSDVRKVMKDAPHDLDITVAALGCVDPVMTRTDFAGEPNIFAKRVSAEVLRLSDEDPDSPKVEAPPLS